jgi:hypothetical protein
MKICVTAFSSGGAERELSSASILASTAQKTAALSIRTPMPAAQDAARRGQFKVKVHAFLDPAATLN